MNEAITIPKLPAVRIDPVDYTVLRKTGIDHITELGSDLWTDFNIHDPGITFLEALCYALTDLAYRTRFPITNLLATPPGSLPDPERQAFFTARQILTVNPWTVRDFRKLLLDVDGIKNAWLICKECPCEMLLYARCADSKLVYEETEHPVTVRGLYDVLIEFDDEDGLGDLNSGKVRHNFVFPLDATHTATALIEMRLPSWHDVDEQAAKFKNLRNAASEVTNVTVQFISGNKDDNVDIPAAQLALALRRPLYATLTIEFKPDAAQPATENLVLEDVPFTVWFRSNAQRKALTLPDIKTAISDATTSGIAARYLALLHRADEIVAGSAASLHSHRNLAEDYCTIGAVQVADVGICADLEVTADSDVEKVVAEAYFQIAQYFAPLVRFRSLKDLLAAGKSVESIFNGPALDQGFIDDDELDEAQLKSTLYASDVINILMDIEGVVAIKNLTLVRYSKDGVREAVYSWSIDIPAGHQPRFYIEGSKLLVFRDGLPFLPDMLEVAATMQFIKGASVPVLDGENDLPVPVGSYADLADYFPVQYSLPQTYGIGHEGLPLNASTLRRAQARQLKAYLFFFEQLLVNYLHQLKNVQELFAVDDTIQHTYFTSLIGPEAIRDIDTDLYDGLTQGKLEELIETTDEALDRRNRFLDHLLARFAEQFSDYALMLFAYESGKAVAQSELLKSKIAYLKDYPFLSANRGRSFNYKDPAQVCVSENVAGLQRRLQLLLNIPDPVFVVEHLLLRPRNVPGPAFPNGDPLLPVCVPPDCHLCGEEDPYSFRITVVLDGEAGLVNTNIPFRRFAERAIRLETPAHLAVKICWVSTEQLNQFQTAWCAWLAELAKPEAEQDAAQLHALLVDLLDVFVNLKNIYPPATLHDCFIGSEDNEVFLGQTVI